MKLQEISRQEQQAQSLSRALDRVQTLKVRVVRRRDGKGYNVHSTTGNGTYVVTIAIGNSTDITCTCPAHNFGHICKHIAAVLLRLQNNDTLQILFDNDLATTSIA